MHTETKPILWETIGMVKLIYSPNHEDEQAQTLIEKISKKKDEKKPPRKDSSSTAPIVREATKG